MFNNYVQRVVEISELSLIENQDVAPPPHKNRDKYWQGEANRAPYRPIFFFPPHRFLEVGVGGE